MNPSGQAGPRPSGAGSMREPFLAGWRLLVRREKVWGGILAAATVVQGFLDSAAVLAMVPLVGFIVDPESTTRHPALGRVHEWLGHPSYVGTVTLLALALLVAVALRGLGATFLQYGLNHHASMCQNRLAQELFQECLAAPYPWFLTRNATLLARLFYDDVTQWSRGFVQRLMSVVNDLITVLIGVALLLMLAPGKGLALVAIAGAAALGLTRGVRPRLQRLGRAKRGALDRMVMSATQALSGIKDVKLSSRQDFFVRLFSEEYRTTSRTHAKLNFWSQVPGLALPVLGMAALVGLLLLQVRSGLSRGDMAAQMALLVLVSSRIVPAVSQLVTSLGSLWNVVPHVEAIENLRRSIRESASGLQPIVRSGGWDGEWRALRLVGVGFQYPNSEAWALGDLTATVESGRAYGVAGPSGAGKSTLIDLMLRLLEPTVGEIQVDGRPLRELDLRAWQSAIGYVAQSPFIADDTLRANVAFGVARKQVDDRWVWDCLRQAQLREFCEGLPEGLDTPVGDRGTRLSGGQRQRVAIARALYNRPRLLVLDEATSALDSISEAAIQAALEALRGRLTTITIAHRLTTIRRCDSILVLEGGRLAAQGGYDKLLAESGLFRRLAAESVPSEEVLAPGP